MERCGWPLGHCAQCSGGVSPLVLVSGSGLIFWLKVRGGPTSLTASHGSPQRERGSAFPVVMLALAMPALKVLAPMLLKKLMGGVMLKSDKLLQVRAFSVPVIRLCVCVCVRMCACECRTSNFSLFGSRMLTQAVQAFSATAKACKDLGYLAEEPTEIDEAENQTGEKQVRKREMGFGDRGYRH
jgi:hypothetical protein